MRLLLFILLLLTAPLTTAGVLFFTDRPTFNAAAPSPLVLEDFENSVLPQDGIAAIGSVLDSSSSNAAFAPGSIVTGLRITAALGLFAQNGHFYSPTNTVFNDFDGDPLSITFPGFTPYAVGLDLLGIFTENASHALTVYDSAGSVLYSANFAPPGAGVFLGFISTAPIHHITMDTGLSSYGFDNIAFDATAETPEPATWMLCAAAISVIALRRR